MENAIYWMILAGFVGMVIYFIDEWRMEKHYENGFWAGRSAGWKASNEHQEKLRKLKSRAVFDYDKN
jgi:hypothetical protein